MALRTKRHTPKQLQHSEKMSLSVITVNFSNYQVLTKKKSTSNLPDGEKLQCPLTSASMAVTFKQQNHTTAEEEEEDIPYCDSRSYKKHGLQKAKCHIPSVFSITAQRID